VREPIHNGTAVVAAVRALEDLKTPWHGPGASVTVNSGVAVGAIRLGNIIKLREPLAALPEREASSARDAEPHQRGLAASIRRPPKLRPLLDAEVRPKPTERRIRQRRRKLAPTLLASLPSGTDGGIGLPLSWFGKALDLRTSLIVWNDATALPNRPSRMETLYWTRADQTVPVATQSQHRRLRTARPAVAQGIALALLRMRLPARYPPHRGRGKNLPRRARSRIAGAIFRQKCFWFGKTPRGDQYAGATRKPPQGGGRVLDHLEHRSPAPRFWPRSAALCDL
jgi:hypothetical protein